MIRKQCLTCLQIYSAEDSVCPKDGNTLSTILVEDLAGATIVGRYQIVKEIGRGGMGVVYEANQIGLDRKVALKMLLNDLSKDEIGWKRFEVEAKAASSLNHPNIIKIYEYAVSEFGLPFMVMDFVEGVSLDELLEKENRLSVSRTLPLFINIANALNHAHKRNIVHRDLKPSNIMLVKNDDDEDNNEMPLILDFGIAKIFAQSGKAALNLTKTGEVFGSPLYMSPEQCMGQPLDPRSDIYSLGCILYQTLSGDTPIKGENFLNVLFNHMNSKPKTLDSVSLNIPKNLENIIYRCLSKIPQERFESMAQLKSELSLVSSIANEIAEIENSSGAGKKSRKKGGDRNKDLDKTVDVTAKKEKNAIAKKPSSSNIEHLKKLAADNDVEAQFDLAWAYELGDEVKADIQMAFHWFKTAANNGHARAMHKTGYMLEKGIGTAVNEKRSFEWFKKAAEAGDVFGERDLGFSYQWGLGVEQDSDLAFFWYQKAAQNGDSTAQFTLGDMYRTGFVGEPDLEKAFDYYCRSAVQNEMYGQYQLALMLLYEEQFRDDERGLMWLEQAAEQGLAQAQHDLAMMFKRGDGVKVDQEKYLNWMIASGEQQHKEAVLELANFYFMRRRESKNLPKALKWLKLASSFGDEQSLARYKQCRKESSDLSDEPE